MKNIIFLTSSYPYLPGEQFIESEIDFWSKLEDFRITIMPMNNFGNPRELPSNINVSLAICTKKSYVEWFSIITGTIFSMLLWRELFYLFKSKKIHVGTVARAIKNTIHVIKIKKSIKDEIHKIGSIDIAYSYWNDVQSYAAASLKSNGIIKKVYSRAHGFDVFESRRPNNYMPLKRQFINNFDLVLAISSQGKSYIEKTYNTPSFKVKALPLGVSLTNTFCKTSDNGQISILSVSSCIKLKRIDKIIKTLALVAQTNIFTKIKWTHIGDGPLREKLISQASEKLKFDNITWQFLGEKTNLEVRKFYEENDVDLFINSSESEGLPVSIMEAMSYGIPAIAPDVGGISEIISNDCGLLLSESPDEKEIAQGIIRINQTTKKTEFRQNAKNIIRNKYNANTNYPEAIKLIIKS